MGFSGLDPSLRSLAPVFPHGRVGHQPHERSVRGAERAFAPLREQEPANGYRGDCDSVAYTNAVIVWTGQKDGRGRPARTSWLGRSVSLRCLWPAWDVTPMALDRCGFTRAQIRF